MIDLKRFWWPLAPLAGLNADKLISRVPCTAHSAGIVP